MRTRWGMRRRGRRRGRSGRRGRSRGRPGRRRAGRGCGLAGGWRRRGGMVVVRPKGCRVRFRLACDPGRPRGSSPAVRGPPGFGGAGVAWGWRCRSGGRSLTGDVHGDRAGSFPLGAGLSLRVVSVGCATLGVVFRPGRPALGYLARSPGAGRWRPPALRLTPGGVSLRYGCRCGWAAASSWATLWTSAVVGRSRRCARAKCARSRSWALVRCGCQASWISPSA